MKIEISDLKIADPTGFQISTELEKISVGISEDDEARRYPPRPEFNGLRVKSTTSDYIFLVDKGYKRLIPNGETYNNLFKDWNGVKLFELSILPTARNISENAILARSLGYAEVYLIEQGMKRNVVSPAAMDKYYFDGRKVFNVPKILIDSINTGPNLQ